MKGDQLGQEVSNARDLTREIEQETNLAIAAQDEREQEVANQEQVVWGRDEARREQTVNLGNKVLIYNPAQVVQEEQGRRLEDEQVREMVGIENGDERKALYSNQESAILTKEREAWNQENLLNELDPKRDHEAQIMAHDQMGIGREMADMVERATKTDNFKIMDLVMMQSKGRDQMLESFENPRRLGDMN